MALKQWVQHISGQGKKRKATDWGELWRAEQVLGLSNHAFLPKSEYVLCEPPEVWVEVKTTTSNNYVYLDGSYFIGEVKLAPLYRIKSIVIERKES